jgi:hypothetical protein
MFGGKLKDAVSGGLTGDPDTSIGSEMDSIMDSANDAPSNPSAADGLPTDSDNDSHGPSSDVIEDVKDRADDLNPSDDRDMGISRKDDLSSSSSSSSDDDERNMGRSRKDDLSSSSSSSNTAEESAQSYDSEIDALEEDLKARDEAIQTLSDEMTSIYETVSQSQDNTGRSGGGGWFGGGGSEESEESSGGTISPKMIALGLGAVGLAIVVGGEN